MVISIIYLSTHPKTNLPTITPMDVIVIQQSTEFPYLYNTTGCVIGWPEATWSFSPPFLQFFRECVNSNKMCNAKKVTAQRAETKKQNNTKAL